MGVGWSGYFKKFFGLFNINFADSWTEPTVTWDENPARIYYEEGHGFNVPGFVVVILVTVLLCVGYVISSCFFLFFGENRILTMIIVYL